jgi:Zn-dependent protease with chaperone function
MRANQGSRPDRSRMDFFERQDKARRNTKALVVYFALAVIALVLAVYSVFALVFARGDFWQPQLFLWVALGTVGVILVGSVSKVSELSSGGSSVASMLGGQPVNPNTSDPDERKLLNVVEEMAIASGVPVPQVYVMNREEGINALAAGYSPSDAVVSVTRGCIRQLNRDELQGVIAHEFSHILNGDMRLNIRLIGLIFGIMCLAVVGRILFHMRGSSRDRNPLPLVGLALLAIGGVGVFFGRLMQSAVSRQREFLADASAVQFTRNPEGLAGALKKIGALTHGSELESAHALEANHLFFGNGTRSFDGLFASHPPLVDRIRRLDPSFNGDFSQVKLEPEGQVVEPGAKTRGTRPPVLFPLPQRAGAASGLAGLTETVVMPAAVLPHSEMPSPEHLRYATDLRNAIPLALQEAARDSLSAQAMMFGLVLSGDERMRREQIKIIGDRDSTAAAEETGKLWPEVSAVAAHTRLPLADLSLPALRLMAPAQFSKFRDALQAVIEHDQKVDLFEYVLQKIVLRHLEPHFTVVRKPVVQFYSAKALVPDAMVLLSALAYVGAADAAASAAAFTRGAQAFANIANQPLALLPNAQCGLAQVDAALGRFAQSVPQIKKNLLNACAQTVAADGVIQEREAELLRAMADALDCPLPPFVNVG